MGLSMKKKNIFTTLMVYKVIVIILAAVLLWFALRPKEAEQVYHPDNTDMVDSLININLKLGEVNENLQKDIATEKERTASLRQHIKHLRERQTTAAMYVEQLTPDEQVVFFDSLTGKGIPSRIQTEGDINSVVVAPHRIQAANRCLVAIGYFREETGLQAAAIASQDTTIKRYNELTENQKEIIQNQEQVITEKDNRIAESQKEIQRRLQRERRILIIGGIAVLVAAIL